jgi:ATP-binding cassette subfamily B protein
VFSALMAAVFMKNVIAEVLAFLYRHWRREPGTVLIIAGSMIAATVADLFLPVFSGRLIDVIAQSRVTPQAATRTQSFHDALAAVAAMTVLGALLIGGRHIAFKGICRLTVKIMSRVAADAFWRVQRFSSDWHANNFAGSVVRRVTRGMWAVDMMDDTLLLALLPALVALLGSSLVLGRSLATHGSSPHRGLGPVCTDLDRSRNSLCCAGSSFIE